MHIHRLHLVVWNTNRIGVMVCKAMVIAGFVVPVTACGNHTQADQLATVEQTVQMDASVTRARIEAKKRLPTQASGAGSVVRAYTPDVRKALVADHGEATYICTPSGFGQTASCRLRS